MTTDGLNRLAADLLTASQRANLFDLLECNDCGHRIERGRLNTRNEYWVKADDGAFRPSNGDPLGDSYNQVCPECGAENSFEVIT